MVKICRTGLLKLNFETRPKKRIFWFLPKISAGHGWSENFFFANFQILGPLGCQGWVVIPQNVKKVKITAPYCPVQNIFFCSPYTILSPLPGKLGRQLCWVACLWWGYHSMAHFSPSLQTKYKTKREFFNYCSFPKSTMFVWYTLVQESL